MAMFRVFTRRSGGVIRDAVRGLSSKGGSGRDKTVATPYGDIMIEYEPYKDDTEFTVPAYPIRDSESEESQRARLLWQSRKRGISENCLILSTFFAEEGPRLTRSQLNQFDILINSVDNDWDLYYWMTGKELPPPPFDTEVLEMLKEFTQNKDMKDRTRQPDLD